MASMPHDQTMFFSLSAFSLFLGTSWLITLLKLGREKRHILLQSFRLKQQLKDQEYQHETIQRLRSERTALLVENKELCAQVASLQTSLTEAGKQADNFQMLLNSTQEQMNQKFQLMAEKIFTEKNQALTIQSSSGLETILKPVREQIADFKKKIEDVYDRESRDRISLSKEIEHLKTLNERISDDAVNLTNALKGRNKLQGFWGEMILEKLLEDSGLRAGHEYIVQKGLKDEHGKEFRPDVIIQLPGERHIIVDSKVSIIAFERACKTDDPTQREQLLNHHLDSIKKHTQDLSGKNYHRLNGIKSPDFVLLFMPVESAFQAALATDPTLTTWMGRKKVVLASPSTLLAILRTINHIWRQDEQSRNGLLIAQQAGSLYDKVIGFLEVFEEIGLRLDQSYKSWKTAKNRLMSGRGNIISKAEALKKLGVQTEKTIPKNLSTCPADTIQEFSSAEIQRTGQRHDKIRNLNFT